MKVGTVVCVTWIDAIVRDNVTRSDPLEPVVAKTYGIVIRDTKDFIAIAHEEFVGSEDLRQVTTIPRGMVKKVDRYR